MKINLLRTLVFAVSTLAVGAVGAHQHFDKVQIKTEKLTNTVYMLTGEGGNMAVSVGKDGVLLVDDQFAPLTPKIKAAIAKISKKPVRFLINTHWHFDHVGGNENFGKSGSLIVAHEKARGRMAEEQMIDFFKMKVQPLPKAGLPVVTFVSDVAFHMNDDNIFVFHAPNAHTDGDAIVHFRLNNVIHMGDTFTNKMYPFIDSGAVGTVEGLLRNAEAVLTLCDPTTKIIPGHGPLAGPKDLEAFKHMLKTVADRINDQLKAGKKVEEVVASKPTKEFDAVWGNGFLKPDQFVAILYQNLYEYPYPADAPLKEKERLDKEKEEKEKQAAVKLSN